jgi:hypothetical protein
MTRQSAKKIILIAGPNGAGKTTFAKEFLPKEANCRTFVNADLIAAGLAPFEPEQVAFQAGRLMLEQIFNHALRGVSFAFETTLSGRGMPGLFPTGRWTVTSLNYSFSDLVLRSWPLPVSGNEFAKEVTMSLRRLFTAVLRQD